MVKRETAACCREVGQLHRSYIVLVRPGRNGRVRHTLGPQARLALDACAGGCAASLGGCRERRVPVKGPCAPPAPAALALRVLLAESRAFCASGASWEASKRSCLLALLAGCATMCVCVCLCVLAAALDEPAPPPSPHATCPSRTSLRRTRPCQALLSSSPGATSEKASAHAALVKACEDGTRTRPLEARMVDSELCGALPDRILSSRDWRKSRHEAADAADG